MDRTKSIIYVAKDERSEGRPLREILLEDGIPKPNGRGFVFREGGSLDSERLIVIPAGMDPVEISNEDSAYGSDYDAEAKKLETVRGFADKVVSQASDLGAAVVYLSDPEVGDDPDVELPARKLFYARANVTFYDIR